MNSLACFVAMSVALWSPGGSFWLDGADKCLSALEGGSAPVIAQQYGGDDPHGPDPHGDDPHDENHDKNLPANKEQKKYKAPKDVYGGEYPNTKEPY